MKTDRYLFRGIIAQPDELFSGFAYGDLLQYANGDVVIRQRETWQEWNVIPETVGQFTGLTDKNGVKIFEGDILQMYRHSDDTHKHEKRQVWINGKYQNDIRIVKYELGTFYTNGICEIKIAFLHMARPGESFEIIGNIHDNPELS